MVSDFRAGGVSGTYVARPKAAGTDYTYADPIASSQGRKASICMRLRIPVEPFPLENFETFVEGDVVYMAVVTSAGAVFLEDSKDLFPSDTFIAQLRLLLP